MTPTDRLARAAAALGLPSGADGAAARTALLRTLSGEDFVPPEETVAAVNTLAGTNLPLTPDAETAETEFFRQELAAFAADYWSLAPDERRARWTDLSGRCPGEREEGQLRQLRPALDVEVTPLPDPELEEVASVSRELFVLPDRPRAIRRAEWLAGRVSRASDEWRTAHRLRDDAPEIVALDPELFDRMERLGRLPASVSAGLPTPTAEEQAERMRRATAEFRQRMVDSDEQTQEETKSGCGWSVSWKILLAIALIRGCAGLVRDSPTPQNTIPTYHYPSTPIYPPRGTEPGKDPFENSKKLIGPDEMEKLLKYYEKQSQIKPFAPQTRPTAR